MTCPCNLQQHPAALDIPPGLTSIPRQLACFDVWLRDMRRSVRDHPALDGWSSRAPDDLGAMLLELWAYVADVQSFYDAVRADEAYVQTANRQADLERLVALLGYAPRPAIAASVWIAVEGSGVKPFTLPARSAFRSGPVEDGPPQVFELDRELTVIPALGALEMTPPAATDVAGAMGLAPDAVAIERLYVQPGSLIVKPGDILVAQRLSLPEDLAAGRIASVTKERFGDEKDYSLIQIDPPLGIAPDMGVDDLVLLTPALRAGLWTSSEVAGDPEPLAEDGTSLVLDGLHRQVRTGDLAVVWADDEIKAALVESAGDQIMTLFPAAVAQAENADGDPVDIEVPAARTHATRLSLDRDAGVPGAAADITVGFGMVAAARLAAPPPDSFQTDPGGELGYRRPWRLRRRWRGRGPMDTTALLVDPFGEGAAMETQIDPVAGVMRLGQDLPSMELAQPVSAYANAALASRGESVIEEELGYGDGAIASQGFVLKRAPLTYLSAPTESGFVSTLRVRVDGVEWGETPSFFGVDAREQVFRVRRNEQGRFVVTFGDGVAGARLATGARVTASYRFGAGAAAPEGGAISQMVSPSDAVTAVHQPFAAWGGADEEGAEELRDSAPASALLIGRAVSMADFEAAALGHRGVSAAQAVWHWSQRRQRPIAQVWFAGDEALEPELSRRLRALCDPSTPVEAEAALAVPIVLSMQVEVAEGHREPDVLAAVRIRLTATEGARLEIARPRIGVALLRSPLVAEALSVEGVHSIDQLLVDGSPLPPLGKPCEAGTWFTVDPSLEGSLVLNGEEAG
jgi:hypothetical protein